MQSFYFEDNYNREFLLAYLLSTSEFVYFTYMHVFRKLDRKVETHVKMKMGVYGGNSSTRLLVHYTFTYFLFCMLSYREEVEYVLQPSGSTKQVIL